MRAGARHRQWKVSHLQEAGSGQATSQLFLVRVWPDHAIEDGGGRLEWHGKVQHVMSGEATDFSDWPMLVARLQAMLPPLHAAPVKEISPEQ